MALSNPIILYPLRFAATSYNLVVTANAVSEVLPFPASGSLTVGRNYWMSNDDTADSDGGEGGVGDLLQMLEAALEAHSEGPAIDIEFDANMKIVITSDIDLQLEFNSGSTTLDNAIWGATSGVEVMTGGTLTMARRPYGYWRPRQPWDDDSREQHNISTGLATSLDGTTYRTRLTERKKTRFLSWSVLEKERVLEEYGDDSGGLGPSYHDQTQTDTFEYMWRAAITYGFPIRVYTDDTDLTLAYSLYQSEDRAEPWRRDEQYRLLWSTQLNLRKYTGTSTSVSAGIYTPPAVSVLPFSKFGMTRAPTTSDDTSAGYSLGSRWHTSWGAEWVYNGSIWIRVSGYSKMTDHDSPACLYNFEYDLTDDTGNIGTLGASSTFRYGSAAPGMIGLVCDEKNNISSTPLTSPYGVALAATTQSTFQLILSTSNRHATTGTPCVLEDTVGFISSFNLATSGATLGIGGAWNGLSAGTSTFMPSAGQLHLLAITHNAFTKQYELYMDGVSIGSPVGVGTYTVPTGNGRMIIAQGLVGMLCSVRVDTVVKTAAEIREEAIRCGFMDYRQA